MKTALKLLLLTCCSWCVIACGGGSSPIGCGAHCPPHESTWTWVSGTNTVDQAGVYGTQGTADPSNVPGARQFAVSWTDKSGNLWLFGGNGVDAITGYLNDLWKFDGTNWTWVNGSTNGNGAGVYGTQGVSSATNSPGGRTGAAAWVDGSGHLWLFGGYGADSAGTTGELNDLWKFDGTNWTWVSGSSLANQIGAYGTKGTASPSNVPGARASLVTWADASGNLWLFGGLGLDSAGTGGSLSDLWKFDGSSWTWVSGSNTVNQSAVYGTLGTASPSNAPGARFNAVSWIDSNGALWLFGGAGTDPQNDLWRFDGTNWTWVGGSNLADQPGVYGTKGTSAPSNIPGARVNMAASADSSGTVWLFGGAGLDSTGAYGSLNDLWKFDGTNWTWVSGPNTAKQVGVYSTKGIASPSNTPGARLGHISWSNKNGNFWVFGGGGYDSTGTFGFVNDLWQFNP